MSPTDGKMLQILALDPTASLRFSQYTHSWYVSSRINLSNGIMVSGIPKHERDPETAVEMYHRTLRDVGLTADSRIVVGHDDKRRHYYWNGSAFAEEPVRVLAETAMERLHRS